MSRDYLVHVRKVLRWCGSVLLFVGLFAVFLAFEKIPGFTLRSVNGSPDLNRIALLGASTVVGLIGITFLFLSSRGFDTMAVAENGVVLPIRSISGMFRGTRSVIPFERISDVRVVSDPRGKTIVEYRIRSDRSAEKTIAYSLEWADDEIKFQRLMSEHVTLREV